MASDPAQIDRFANRIMAQQDVRFGTVALNLGSYPHPIPPLHVAAVLHALADHTHNKHMLDVAESALMRRDGTDSERCPATNLGRYLHALADRIEMETFDA